MVARFILTALRDRYSTSDWCISIQLTTVNEKFLAYRCYHSRLVKSSLETKSNFQRSAFLVKRMAAVSVSLALWPCSFTITVNATSWELWGLLALCVIVLCNVRECRVLNRAKAFNTSRISGVTQLGLERRSPASDRSTTKLLSNICSHHRTIFCIKCVASVFDTSLYQLLSLLRNHQ